MVEKYSDDEFEALLGKYDYNFKRGDIVKGVVCAYESDGAIVDIGSKSTAFVPSYEISSDRKAKAEDVLEKSTEYEFLITQDSDENGKFILSYKKVHLAHTWAELAKVKDADETIIVTVTQTVKGGLIVDVSGVQGFIPQGQLCARETVCNVGDKLEVKILTLDKAQNNLILSNRKVYETNMAETRKNVFAQIEVGQIVKGEVVRITDFGAFVNIGGVDCLLPLSQISWKWVEHPTDLLKVGQEINVEIIDIDHDKQRISLSLKNTEPDPWIKAGEELKEGDIKEGVVTRVKGFGAFVEVEKGIDGLVHVSQISHEWLEDPTTAVTVGQEVDVKVTDIDFDKHRVSFSMKALLEPPVKEEAEEEAPVEE